MGRLTGRFDVVVVGGANMDYLVRADHLPRAGDTVEGSDLLEAPGGKGANQAVAAARLGARVALVARVGADDRGREIIRRLADERVHTQMLACDLTAPTGVALIAVDRRGDKQIITAPGANRKLGVADVEAAAALIAGARVLLVQFEVSMAAVAAAIRLARESGARVVLDPAPPAPVADEVIGDVDVIRPNAAEAEALTGIAVDGQQTAARAGAALIGRGAGAACIGAPGGNLLVWPGGELWLPHLPVPSIDATGAGDAFAGALAVALAEQQPLDEAARFAHAAAAWSTTRLGAQAGLPTRAQVASLLQRYGAAAAQA